MQIAVQNVSGFYPEPTCIAVCPINCIIVDPAHIEDQTQLMDKFKQLNIISH